MDWSSDQVVDPAPPPPEITDPATGHGSASALTTKTVSGHASGKTRSSCDRCHGQKLRCVRDKGVATPCRRCQRLKAPCRYSPRASRIHSKPLESSSQSSTVVKSSPGFNPSSLPCDPTPGTDSLPFSDNDAWEIPSCAPPHQPSSEVAIFNTTTTTQDSLWPGILPGGPGSLDVLETFSFNNWPAPPADGLLTGGSLPIFDTLDPLPIQDGFDRAGLHSYATKELARLSVQIYGCVESLPSLKRRENATPTSTAAGDDYGGLGNEHVERITHPQVLDRSLLNQSRKSANFIFDELFNLTTEFINTVELFASPEHLAHNHPSPHASNTDFPSSSTLSRHMAPYHHYRRTTGDTGLPRMDEPTTAIIFNCHSRLSEAYKRILKMMQACLEHSAAPGADSDTWAVILPKLHVGPVTLPTVQVDAKNLISSKLTTAMYMYTITSVMSLLWSRLADVVKGVTASQSRCTPAVKSSLVVMMWDAMSQRNVVLIQAIEFFKSLPH